MEKHIYQQSKLYYNFIDFKKSFDRVWYDSLWHAMMTIGILRTIELERNFLSSSMHITDQHHTIII